MKKSTIYEVAIKLAGLYLFYLTILLLKETAIYTFVYLNFEVEYGDFGNTNLISLVYSICNLAFYIPFAFFLTFHTPKIVKWIFKANEFEEVVEIKTNKKGLYEIALVISSLLLIISVLPEFIVNFKKYLTLSNFHNNPQTYDTVFLWVAGGKIILGVLIIAGAEMISSFLVKEKNTYSNT
ncbi:MAG: hypothetical protein ACKVQB_11210 [Bacteroidia bacterium]